MPEQDEYVQLAPRALDWLTASPWHIALTVAAVLALIALRIGATALRARALYGPRRRRPRPQQRENWIN